MSKVQFIYKTGRRKMIRQRDAELLRRLGQGTYLTRDLVAQRSDSPPETDIDSMDKDQLHALAKSRGVKVHPRAGANKIRAALREAQ